MIPSKRIKPLDECFFCLLIKQLIALVYTFDMQLITGWYGKSSRFKDECWRLRVKCLVRNIQILKLCLNNLVKFYESQNQTVTAQEVMRTYIK